MTIQIPSDSIGSKVIVSSDVKDFLLNFNGHTEGTILRAGLLVNQAFFAKLFISIFPFIKNGS